MLVAPDFLESAVQQIHDGCDMAFAGVGEYGDVVYPNALGFLGFADKTYQTGETYHSSNQQCMLLSKTLAMNVRFDEYIEAYGYEEMDHSYRVAAAGYKIGCVSSCTNLHLAPTRHLPFRCEQDANRLYVTYKRYAYIEHRALKAFFYLLLAVPHNLLANVRRAGMKRGLTDSISNFYLAWRTLAKFWRKPLADIPKSASTLTVRS
jgi:hypothetical protein